MHHIRLTERKITRRLELIETLIYRRRQPLPPFRFHAGDEPLVAPNVNDGDWPVIEPGACWGKLRQDFTLRTTFTAPADWQEPIALFLPIGNARQFVHPEALAYVDGHAYQGVNAYHQEILLLPRCCDGIPHVLALHGWFGIGNEPVLMGQPEIVQIHQPTRDFVAAARVALGVVKELDEDETADATITLKVMHTGYYDQVRKWDGESFWDEAVERGFIFWTPELVPQPAER